jgi:hypothetical protein
MAWTAPSETDLLATLSAREADLYRQSRGGGPDPVPALLARAAGLCRAHVRAGGKCALGPDGTVPASLMGAACDLAAFDLCKRFPGGVPDDRRAARDAALDTLRAVAEGRLVPEPPDGAEGSAPTGVLVIRKPRRLGEAMETGL